MERLAIRVIKGKESIIDEWYDSQLVDYLLTRNWFLSVDDIIEVLAKADEDAWRYVYQNRQKYATRIQQAIEPQDFMFPAKKVRFHEVDLTDKMVYEMDTKERKEREQRENEEWEQYIRDNQLERPLMSCDSDAQDLFQKIQIAEAELEKYMRTRKSKYVSPILRSSQPMDTKEADYRNKLDSLKTEYKNMEEYIINQDELWLANKKLVWLKSGTVF